MSAREPTHARRRPAGVVAGVAAARFAVTVAGSVAALVLLWYAFLKVFSIDAFVGKTPGDVWRYLADGADAGANRALLRAKLAETLYDAGIGFAAGFSASALTAIAFVLWRPVERALMPAAMAIRSVPIVAMVPVLAVLFGRDALGTIVTVSIVVFFPTLVLVAFGLRSVTPEAVELLAVYDAGALTLLRKVQLPSALPSIFAAASVAAPGAVLGALLSEWLVTGRGLGRLISEAVATSEFARLWAAAMIVMVLSIVLYSLVSAIEELVTQRFAR